MGTWSYACNKTHIHMHAHAYVYIHRDLYTHTHIHAHTETHWHMHTQRKGDTPLVFAQTSHTHRIRQVEKKVDAEVPNLVSYRKIPALLSGVSYADNESNDGGLAPGPKRAQQYTVVSKRLHCADRSKRKFPVAQSDASLNSWINLCALSDMNLEVSQHRLDTIYQHMVQQAKIFKNLCGAVKPSNSYTTSLYHWPPHRLSNTCDASGQH